MNLCYLCAMVHFVGRLSIEKWFLYFASMNRIIFCFNDNRSPLEHELNGNRNAIAPQTHTPHSFHLAVDEWACVFVESFFLDFIAKEENHNNGSLDSSQFKLLLLQSHFVSHPHPLSRSSPLRLFLVNSQQMKIPFYIFHFVHLIWFIKPLFALTFAVN